MTKGWYESPDYTGKAPEHREASNKNVFNNTLRQPLIPQSSVFYIIKTETMTERDHPFSIMGEDEYKSYKEKMPSVIVSKHDIKNKEEYWKLVSEVSGMNKSVQDILMKDEEISSSNAESEQLKYFRKDIKPITRGKILLFLKENNIRLKDGKVLSYSEYIDHVITTNKNKNFKPIIEKNLNYVWDFDENKWVKLS